MTQKTFESRTAKPVLLNLTETDRKRLKLAAKRRKMPMATFAYFVIRDRLESEYGEGGAQ